MNTLVNNLVNMINDSQQTILDNIKLSYKVK